MVLLGGLEIVAAGTLLHRMKQNRRAEMQREAEEALRQRGWVPNSMEKPTGQQQHEQSSGFLAPTSLPQRPLSVPPPGYVASGWYQGQREPQYPLGQPSQPYMQNTEYPSPRYPPPYPTENGPPPADFYMSSTPYSPPPEYQQRQTKETNQGCLAPSKPAFHIQTRPHEHDHRSRSEDPEEDRERLRPMHRRTESSSHHHHRHHHP